GGLLGWFLGAGGDGAWSRGCGRGPGVARRRDGVVLRDRLDRVDERVGIDRLGEMAKEPGLEAPGDVFARSVAAERDGAHGAPLAEPAYEIVTGSVGETDVAQDDVDAPVRALDR